MKYSLETFASRGPPSILHTFASALSTASRLETFLNTSKNAFAINFPSDDSIKLFAVFIDEPPLAPSLLHVSSYFTIKLQSVGDTKRPCSYAFQSKFASNFSLICWSLQNENNVFAIVVVVVVSSI